MVRAASLVALLVLALLFVAASWVDAGMAAAPDPHPSAKKSAPAPDPYRERAPSEPESSPAKETSTQPVTQVETAPSTSATRTQAEPKTTSAPGTRTQKEPEKKPEKAAATQQTAQTNQRNPARLAAAAATDGRPLLLGGLAMLVLALASGSLLFLVTRSGTAGLGKWEAKP